MPEKDFDECGCSRNSLFSPPRRKLQDFQKALTTGSISMIYALDLFDFIEIKDRRENDKNYPYKGVDPVELQKYLLNSVRGTAAFRYFLKNLSLQTPLKSFSPDETKDRAVRQGNEFSVFRGSLTNLWLEIPTFYCLSEEQFSPNIQKEDIKYFFRFSTAGLIEVTIEIQIKDLPLIELLEFLLENRRNKYVSNEDSGKSPKPENDSISGKSRWDTAVENAVEFISQINWQASDSISRKTPENIGESEIEHLYFRPKAGEKNVSRRQRYSVVMLHNIECQNKKCRKRIPAAVIHEEISLLQCIMEGTLIAEKPGKLPLIPEVPKRKKLDFKDLSNWKDELCVFGEERCLIYFKELDVMETTQNHCENYADYWKSIVRGIEHSIAIRVTLNIIEAQTLKHLRLIPNLMLSITDDNLTPDDRERLKQFARRLSNIVNLLPSVRKVTVSASSFSSTHAVEKFQFLNDDCFHFSDILRNVSNNVDELTRFLMFFKQQQLQLTIDADNSKDAIRDRLITFLGLLLTIFSVCFLYFSFRADYTAVEFTMVNAQEIEKIETIRQFVASAFWIYIYSALGMFVLTLFLYNILKFFLKKFDEHRRNSKQS